MNPEAETEEIEIRLLLEAISLKYGYDLRDYAAEPMRRRIRAAKIRSGAAHLGEMQHRLLVNPEFFADLLNQLTVQVSEMFRDPPLYVALRERVLPILRTYPELRVWHAGCASGEEVYTTAVLMEEEGLHERTQIYATDLSATAIERARDGIYSESQAVAFSTNYENAGGKGLFEAYCSRAYGSIAMRESLRKQLVFFQHNLVSDYALGEMHVIFCRNVLMYFGHELRCRVLKMFAKGLCRGGFLCVGGSERLPKELGSVFEEFDGANGIYRFRGQP